MDKVTFHVRLTRDDWVEEREGWRCEALRVGSVESLVVGRASYKPEARGDIVLRPHASLDPAAPVLVEVALAVKEAPKTNWATLAGITTAVSSIVGIAVAGYFNGLAERIKADSVREVAQIQAQVTKFQSQVEQERQSKQAELDKAAADKSKAVDVAKVECDQAAQKKLENCVSKGLSSADCSRSTFNFSL